jgi:hypothetical protein
MARQPIVSEHILEVMRRIPDCRLDDLVLNCQDFPLQAVLTEVSYLSREGHLQLTLLGTGLFTVQRLSVKSQSRLVRGSLNKGGVNENGQR